MPHQPLTRAALIKTFQDKAGRVVAHADHPIGLWVTAGPVVVVSLAF